MSVAGVCERCGRRGRFYPAEPDGYVARAEWAERKMRTHHQERCPGCGRWSVWKLGPPVGEPGGRSMTRLTDSNWCERP